MKQLVLLIALITGAFAIDFQTFKREVLANAKILEAQKLELAMQRERNRIDLRSENPELGIEGARYNADGGEDTWGYALDLRQRVRTGSFMKGLRQKAEAAALLRRAYQTEGRAGFLKTLETLYTRYVYAVKREAILREEQQLLQQVAQMVEARYKSGSDTKVSWLQAKSEADALKSEVITAKIRQKTLYRQMMALAGISESTPLEARFLYTSEVAASPSDKPAPALKIAEAKERLYAGEYTARKGSFRRFDIVGGVEKEPDQTIGRVGVALPLVLFNRQKEERALAKLKMKQAALQKAQLQIETEQQKRMYRESITLLGERYRSLETLYKEQKALTQLLEEGYKIAKSSVFVLMRAKNKLIETRKALLKTQKEINEQTIALRFLQGAYND